jgi:type IV fimbrial biogenesis protein FimT
VPPSLPRFASRLHPAAGRHAAWRKAQLGFKLLELSVTLTIMAVLASVGMSNWTGLTEKEAVKGQVNALIGAMRFARSEAIKKNARVVICPRDLSAAPINGTYPCNIVSGAGWENGWIIFIDQGANNQYEAADTLLKEQGTLSGSGGIIMDNGSNSDRIVFRNSGILYFGASNITFLPSSRDTSRGAMVCISMQGRARVTSIASNCIS